MAEALFAKYSGFDGDGLTGSAGIRGLDGQMAHPLAQNEMRKRDIDLSGHRARSVTPDLLTASDLILTMETSQQAWLQTKMPTVQRRVHLLGGWRDREVVDPVNGGPAEFAAVAEEIEQYVLDWIHSIEGAAVEC